MSRLTSISGLSSAECDSLFCPIKNNGLISVIRKIGVLISFTGILILIIMVSLSDKARKPVGNVMLTSERVLIIEFS